LQVVRFLAKQCALDLLPKLQVLANLLDAKLAMNVSCPFVVLQPVSNRSRFAASFWNARVERGRNLLNRSSIQPSVVPELSSMAIAKNHRRGNKEQGTLLVGELELQAMPGPLVIDLAEPPHPV
jgi:hypothetical protein